MDWKENGDRFIRNCQLGNKSKILSICFLGSSVFSIYSLNICFDTQQAQAQATAQDIQQVGRKVCSFMGGRSKPDRQILLIITNVLEQDLADVNPVSLALNRYVLKNCPKDYLAYQQRKRKNNPFAKNPLIVQTGVPLLSGNSTPETAESYRSQGEKLLAARNYQEAIVAYNRAIALDSSTANDYFYRAWSLYQVKKLELALTDLDRAIQLNPDNADYYLGRGLVVATMGDRETALANYSRAIELNPKLAQAYHQRSSLRRKLGDIEGANLDRAMAVKLGIK
jgi:tetratricopeptide (TPR) repeat protein